jgi:hypothetical protein
MPLHPFLILLVMVDALVIAGQMYRRHQEENLPFEGFREGRNSPALYSALPEGQSHLQPCHVAH